MRGTALLILILLQLVGCESDSQDSSKSEKTAHENPDEGISFVKRPSEANEQLSDWPEIVAASEPSVISLEVETQDGKSTGTGFVVSADGLVITNFHVIQHAVIINAKNHQGFSLHCQGLVTIDEERDLALLKFAAKNLSVLELSEKGLSKGQEIMAIGNPRGFDSSVTTGIISAFRDEDSTQNIQFDAAVSPGSSGSPLFDRTGKVVGVVTSGDSTRQGINFAVASVHVIPLLAAGEQLEPVSLTEAFSQPLPEAELVLGESEVDLPIGDDEVEGEVASIESEIDEKWRMLNVFWNSYWNSFDDPTGSSWAVHFTDSCDYQYKKDGPADRVLIAKEAFSLKQKYPQRTFRIVSKPEITYLNENRIGFDFDFEYFYQNGSTLRAGISKTELALVWTDDSWLIYKFREKVEPYNKDEIPKTLPVNVKRSSKYPVRVNGTPEVGQAGYMVTRDGAIRIWNNSYQQGDQAEWDGRANENGFANGRGTLSWFKDGEFQYCYIGLMVQGKFDGQIRTADKSGNVGIGRYDRGSKTGVWSYSNKSGTRTWSKRY